MNIDDILEALDAMPEDQREQMLAAADEIVGDIPWLPNPGPQTDAYYCEADELFYGGQAGGGKALEINSPVLTPTGWKAIGSLKVGDPICATDGTVAHVIGVFPQGVRPLYRVTMRDGASVLADLDHQWLAWRTHGNTKLNNVSACGPASARKWTTAQMIEEMSGGPQAGGRLRGFALPVAAPVRFNVAGQLKGRGNFVPREIDPYVLGLILGDGCIQPKDVRIGTADGYIRDRVVELYGADITVSERADGFMTCSFRGEARVAMLRALDRLGLSSTGAADKFIPRQYLFATEPERWELMRGLLDTDGWVEPKRGVFFTSISEQLAKDVAHLAMSLGCVAWITSRIPTFTHKGEKKQGQRAYVVRIKAPAPEECFALPRKREIAAGIKHQSISRVIESIEYERDGEAVCIAVSHPNSLYITEGFIVTHNSALIIGLALTAHQRSLILRRTNKEARGFVEEIANVLGTRDGFNGQDDIWRLPDGRTIEIGGCQLEDDKQKYKGRAHDLKAFDELADFTESQYEFICTWNRSTVPGQRCRVVATGNPPTTAEGLWVIRRWAAWLDPSHPNPAKPGELRWYTNGPDGREIEVDGPGPHEINGEWVTARSRTFIPAKLSDNPDLVRTNYAAVLAALPEELRAAYRDGRFDLGLKDQPFQAIPTAWIKASMARWTERPPASVPMCAIAVDCSGGGEDPMVIARRHDGWYDKLIEIPGKDIPAERAGSYAGGMVIAHRRDNALVIVDMGGGYGGPLYEHLSDNQINVTGYKGGAGGTGRTRDGQLEFYNARSAAIWRFREALDPDQPGGAKIILPPDNELLAELSAPSFEVKGKKIQVESKESVCKRIGRSTNKADAVVMAWTKGLKSENVPQGDFSRYDRRATPKVIMGYAQTRRR